MNRIRSLLWVCFCLLCGGMLVWPGYAAESRKWTNGKLDFQVQRDDSSVSSSSASSAHSPVKMVSKHGRSHRSRRLVLGIVMGSFTGIMAAGVVACAIRASVLYVNRTPLMKGPIVFDSNLEPKIIGLIAGEGFLAEQAELVGGGPNGKVFKLSFDNGNGSRALAVKMLDTSVEAMDPSSGRKNRRLIQEKLVHIGRASHRNLVAIKAYIPCPNSHLLVSDLVPNGSLEDALRKAREKRFDLSWATRQKIAVGVILGLEYLHFQCDPCIVHCDLKPKNILLGEDFEPLLVDYGLDKLMPNCGAPGYVAPECFQSRNYTDKSDVFSFGVVLAVLLTGREPTDSFFDGENGNGGTNMGNWLRQLQQNGKAMEALDRSIAGEEEEDEEEEEKEERRDDMLMAVKIAAVCLADLPAERPSSAELVSMLTQLHSF